MFKLTLACVFLGLFLKLTYSSSILPCDFENNTFCSWENDNVNSWTLDYPARIFKKSLMEIMPRADHILKTSRGHFAYLSHEEEDSNLYRKAVLSATDSGRQ